MGTRLDKAKSQRAALSPFCCRGKGGGGGGSPGGVGWNYPGKFYDTNQYPAVLQIKSFPP